jgi:hypothetical protein
MEACGFFEIVVGVGFRGIEVGWRSNGVKGVTALVVGRLWRRCVAAAREEGRQRPWAPPRPAPPPPHPQAGAREELVRAPIARRPGAFAMTADVPPARGRCCARAQPLWVSLSTPLCFSLAGGTGGRWGGGGGERELARPGGGRRGALVP